jgi:hypothetical protein
MEVPAAYPGLPAACLWLAAAWASHVMQPPYGTVGPPLGKGGAISLLGYRAE